MTLQQVAPARNGTQVVSALPLWLMTIASARIAPTHSGSSRIATIVFAHFGMNPEFKRAPMEARRIQFRRRPPALGPAALRFTRRNLDRNPPTFDHHAEAKRFPINF